MLRHGDIKTPVNMESCHIPKGWGEEIIIENMIILGEGQPIW